MPRTIYEITQINEAIHNPKGDRAKIIASGRWGLDTFGWPIDPLLDYCEHRLTQDDLSKAEDIIEKLREYIKRNYEEKKFKTKKYALDLVSDLDSILDWEGRKCYECGIVLKDKRLYIIVSGGQSECIQILCWGCYTQGPPGKNYLLQAQEIWHEDLKGSKNTPDQTPEYKRYLKSPVWREKRKQVLERDKHRCTCCNTEDDVLDIHHKHYKNIGKEHLSDLITLCRNCHRVVESESM